MYEAIRLLSIVKEAEDTPQRLMPLKKAEDLQNNMGELSEMAQIRNLHWWTVEYGLERWKIQRFMLDCCHLLAKVHCMT
jgi:phenylalanine-4-hydroxylase